MMKGHPFQDNNSAIFLSDDLIRMRKVLSAVLGVNQDAPTRSIDRNYQLLMTVPQHVEPAAIVTERKIYNTAPTPYCISTNVPNLVNLKHTIPHIMSLAPPQPPPLGFQCTPQPPPSLGLQYTPQPSPPGFKYTAIQGLNYICVSYSRNTNVRSSVPAADDLDIHEIIEEFRSTTRIHENYEREVRCKQEAKMSGASTSGERSDGNAKNKESDKSQKLFSKMAEEVCFNDDIIKDICIRQLQTTKYKERMPYTKNFTRNE